MEYQIVVDKSCIGWNMREHIGDRGQIPFLPVTENVFCW